MNTSRTLVRKLQMITTGSSEIREIIIRIGLPEPDPIPGGDFRVRVEIDGFDQPYSRHIHGVDELHALLEGCWMVPHLVSALAPTGAKVTWLGDQDLGFARAPTIP